jgi:hypothetical protein
MAVNYLITTENLKKKGLIHSNVDTKLLTIAIKRVQDMVIQEATGSPLFRALLLRTENNNWDSDYRTLMDDYIIPCLVAHVDFKVALLQNKKITNKTTGKNSDEYITALSDSELSPFQSELLEDAGYYKTRLIGFLKDDCGETYSEYTEAITRTNHDLKKSEKGYQSKWWT